MHGRAQIETEIYNFHTLCVALCVILGLVIAMATVDSSLLRTAPLINASPATSLERLPPSGVAVHVQVEVPVPLPAPDVVPPARGGHITRNPMRLRRTMINEVTPPYRRYDCRSYRVCLDEACASRWESWCCIGCNAFEPADQPEVSHNRGRDFSG